MLEVWLVAFTTFFATIGPPNAAAMFAAMTPRHTGPERRAMALKGVLVAAGILLSFALFGDVLLSKFGITLPALRTAGGILLLLISIDMVFARSSGGTGTTQEEAAEARNKEDLSVFPIASPLLAGPGAMGAAVLLMADVQDDIARQALVILAMLSVLLLTYLMMLTATPIQRILGVTGIHVITRIIGILLAALAVQFIFDGIGQSGLLPS